MKSVIAPNAPKQNSQALMQGQRVCQKCKRYVSAKGGKYQATDRLHQRWVCAECVKKEEVPPMHPLFAQMLGYAPAIEVTLPESCTRVHLMKDDPVSVMVSEETAAIVLSAMRGESSVKELTEKTGLHRATVIRAVRQLNDDGRIRFLRNTKYFGRVFVRTGEAA